MIIQDKQKRLWAEIDLNRIEHNFKQLKGNICCVIKANAYGHGSIQLAKFYEKIGASFFAVSNIEEAIQLRNNNIKLPILILGYTPIECAKDLAINNLIQAVYSKEYAIGLNNECLKNDIKVKIHIKIDTGMGRIGFQYTENSNELSDALFCCKLPSFIVDGIFTHFAISDEGYNNFTIMQKRRFDSAINYLKSNLIRFNFIHCQNSAAIIDYKFENDYNLMRAGIILYGYNPTNNSSIDLLPALKLYSVVSNVKEIKKGDSVSYGRTFIAEDNMMVATIPIGYADGFFRSNTDSFVFINGKKCKIIGRVCMDQIMVACSNAKIGDRVEIYGDNIHIQDVAKHNKTIVYELLTAIAERVPRVYYYDDNIVEIVDKLE